MRKKKLNDVERKLKAAVKLLRKRRKQEVAPTEQSVNCFPACETCGFYPHAMDCSVLAKIVAMYESGYCAQCGSKLKIERDGQIVWCPKGCMRRWSF